MVQAGKHLDLILVAAHILSIQEGCLNDFDGDLAAQELIPGTVNGPHRTAADLLKETIPATEKDIC